MSLTLHCVVLKLRGLGEKSIYLGRKCLLPDSSKTLSGWEGNDLICNENIHCGYIFPCAHYIHDPQLGQYYQIAGCVSAYCACPRWWAMFRYMQVCSSVKGWFIVFFISEEALHVIIVSKIFLYELRGEGVGIYVCICRCRACTHCSVSGCHPESWFRWIMLSHTCSVSVSRWSLSRFRFTAGHPQLRAEVPWNRGSTGD